MDAPLRSLKIPQIAILLAALVLLGIFGYAVHTVQSFRNASDALLRMQEARVQLADAFVQLKELHNATRAYLTSGDERALAIQQESVAAVDREMAKVRPLLRAQHPAAWQRVEEVIGKALAEYDTLVGLRRDRGAAAVSARVAEGSAKSLADELRVATVALQAEVAEALEPALETVRRDTTVTLAVLAGGLVLDIVLVLAVVVMLRRDFRAREAAAAALRRHANEIEDLYNHAPCGYHSLDADGRFVAINDTELEWLGYTRDEVIGRMRMAELLAPPSRPSFETALAQLRAGADVRDVEVEVCRKDGRTFPACLVGSVIRDAGGRFVTTRATLFDITERKRIEQVMAQARDYAESIVDTVREPLVILTRDLRVNSANRIFYETFGSTAAETIGRPFAELSGGAWTDPRLLAELSRIVPEHAELNGFEVTADVPGLGRKIMLLNARKLHRIGNGTTMMLLAIEDVTERKLAEARLKDANRSLATRSAELEAANRELESFSYSVSHDLRAPLRHIDYFAGALRKQLAGQQLDPKAERQLNSISSSAQTMGQLIDDLLSFARIGRAELRRTSVNLDEIVAESRQAAQTGINGRTIEWAIAPLPAVHGDSALLRQVFANLLGNAVKYTRPKPAARIEIEGRRDESGDVTVIVRDNGAGFDMRYVDKLFGVFQRLHSNHEFEGTGVGLANVRRIVERHGGRVWAEGEVNRGATFYVRLPAAPTRLAVSSS